MTSYAAIVLRVTMQQTASNAGPQSKRDELQEAIHTYFSLPLQAHVGIETETTCRAAVCSQHAGGTTWAASSVVAYAAPSTRRLYLAARVPGILAHAAKDEEALGALGHVVLVLHAGGRAAVADHYVRHLGQCLRRAVACCELSHAA